MDFLLVEDSEIAVWIIKSNLERLGHHVDVAKTGLEALTLFYREYDAILLDVCLPEMNGLEVARIIRLKETKRNLILGISSLGSQIRDECLRAGFNDVYKKPVEVQDLLKIIMRIQDVERTSNYARSSQTNGGVQTAHHGQAQRRALP